MAAPAISQILWCPNGTAKRDATAKADLGWIGGVTPDLPFVEDFNGLLNNITDWLRWVKDEKTKEISNTADVIDIGVTSATAVNIGNAGAITTIAGTTVATLTAPTIASFANATHAHTNAASGGLVDHVSLSNKGTLTHATIDSYLDQAVKVASSPTFNAVNVTAAYTPRVDTGTATSLQIGTTNATGILIGKLGIVTAIQGTINIGTNEATDGIITIGNPTAEVHIVAGSFFAPAPIGLTSVNVDGGTGADAPILFNENLVNKYRILYKQSDNTLRAEDGAGTNLWTATSLNFAVSTPLSATSITVDGFGHPTTDYISLRPNYIPYISGGVGITALDHDGNAADGLGIYGHDGISLYTGQTQRLKIASNGFISFPVNATAVSSASVLQKNSSDEITATTITGTANQITVTPSSGAITLSLPQNLATTSNPSFNTVTTSNVRKTNTVKKVVVFGSSVSAGHGATDFQGWAYQLGTALVANGYSYVNKGIPGDTTTRLLARFFTDVVVEDPTFVIIALSLANEGLAFTSVVADKLNIYKGYLKNINKLVSLCRTQGYIPIVAANYPFNSYTAIDKTYVDKFNTEMEESNIAFIDYASIVDDGTAHWHSGLTADGLHPNDTGHNLMYRSISIDLFDTLYSSSGNHVGTYTPSSHAITLPANATFAFVAENLSGSTTVSFYFNANGTLPNGTCLVQLVDSDLSATSTRVRIQTVFPGLVIKGDTVNNLTSPKQVFDNMWHHCAVSFNRFTKLVKFYIDGSLVGSVTDAATTSVDSIVIGGRIDGSSVACRSMKFKDMIVYRTTLTDVDVFNCYQGHPKKGALDIMTPVTGDPVYGDTLLANISPYSYRYLTDPTSSTISKTDRSLGDSIGTIKEINSKQINSLISIKISPVIAKKSAYLTKRDTGNYNRSSAASAVSVWTLCTTEASSWYGMCWSPELGLFCAVTTEAVLNSVMTSPDGVTWTRRNTIATTGEWTAVTWSPELGLFCAVAASGTNQVMTSPDGINWTARTSSSTNRWYGLAWSAELGLFCATSETGSSNQVMTSPDGINWTSQTTPATLAAYRGLSWSPELGLFCAVGMSGTANRIMTSPDGVTWTSNSGYATDAWRGITWSPELGLFCAVALTGSTNQVMTSPDGINWTARTPASTTDWRGITWSPELGLFCAVSFSGTGNRIMTSPDGMNWTSQTSPADVQWFCPVWSPELGIFCISALNGGVTAITISQNIVQNTSIKGRVSGSVPSGCIGETPTDLSGGWSVYACNSPFGLTSITLTAGKWLLIGQTQFGNNSLNTPTATIIAFSTTQNSFTGSVTGLSRLDSLPNASLTLQQIVSVASSTTIWLNVQTTATSGNAQNLWGLQALRVG